MNRRDAIIIIVIVEIIGDAIPIGVIIAEVAVPIDVFKCIRYPIPIAVGGTIGSARQPEKEQYRYAISSGTSQRNSPIWRADRAADSQN